MIFNEFFIFNGVMYYRTLSIDHKYDFPLFISFKKYKQKYPHVVVIECSEFDYFDAIKLYFFFFCMID